MGKGSDTSQTSAVISHASSRIQLEPSATCHSHHNRRGVKDKRVIYPYHLVLSGTTSYLVRNRVHTHCHFFPMMIFHTCPFRSTSSVISSNLAVSHVKKNSFLHSLKIEENPRPKKKIGRTPLRRFAFGAKAYQTVKHVQRCGGYWAARVTVKGKERRWNCTFV